MATIAMTWRVLESSLPRLGGLPEIKTEFKFDSEYMVMGDMDGPNRVRREASVAIVGGLTERSETGFDETMSLSVRVPMDHYREQLTAESIRRADMSVPQTLDDLTAELNPFWDLGYWYEFRQVFTIEPGDGQVRPTDHWLEFSRVSRSTHGSIDLYFVEAAHWRIDQMRRSYTGDWNGGSPSVARCRFDLVRVA